MARSTQDDEIRDSKDTAFGRKDCRRGHWLGCDDVQSDLIGNLATTLARNGRYFSLAFSWDDQIRDESFSH